MGNSEDGGFPISMVLTAWESVVSVDHSKMDNSVFLRVAAWLGRAGLRCRGAAEATWVLEPYRLGVGSCCRWGQEPHDLGLASSLQQSVPGSPSVNKFSLVIGTLRGHARLK